MSLKNNFQIEYDKNLLKILKEINSSICFSTYQAGRVMVISTDENKLIQIPFPFRKPMGIAIQESKLAIATIDSIEFLSNKEEIASTVNNNINNFDTFYLHRASYNTNSLDIHDIHFGNGQLWGANTKFSCLCVFDINYNFVPKWKPNFISDLVPEDRCHLNGFAMQDGMPKYATALSSTNFKEGWREDIMKTGVIIEIPSSEILIDGLAMPHSPLIINDDLYFLESGNGRLMKFNKKTNNLEVIEEFNVFTRGMSHMNGYLFIGKSKIRQSSKTFNLLGVKDNSKNAGIIIYNLIKKKIEGQLDYLDTVEEIFDIQIIPGYTKPAIINKKDDLSKKIITFQGNIFWKKDAI